MSADDWSVCPRCKNEAVRAAEELQQEADSLWGADRILWQMAHDKAQAAVADLRNWDTGNSEEHCTFREDYEIYGAETGTITVVYRGCCTRSYAEQVAQTPYTKASGCGARLEFTHEHPIP